MKFNNNEEAVSPVIGVILMVAITVILAAVIAVFVFGMADDIDSGKTVAATAKQSGTNILVTYQGGPDASKVDAVYVAVFDADGKPVANTITASGTGLTNDQAASNGYFNWTASPKPGYTMTISGAGSPDQERVVISADFDDGTSQVILDKLL